MPPLGRVSQIVENLGKSAVEDFGKFVQNKPGLFSKLEEVATAAPFGKNPAVMQQRSFGGL